MPRLTVVILAYACGLVAHPVYGEAQTFKDYPCTVDCSGHQAGYDWAQGNGVTDEADCSGNSNSFNEGCRAWVEEQEADNPDNDGGGDDEPDEAE